MNRKLAWSTPLLLLYPAFAHSQEGAITRWSAEMIPDSKSISKVEATNPTTFRKLVRELCEKSPDPLSCNTQLANYTFTSLTPKTANGSWYYIDFDPVNPDGTHFRKNYIYIVSQR